METITLSPQWHNNGLFIAIGGKLRGHAFHIVNNTPGRHYSKTHGGYLVPSETEAEIGRKLADVSPIRAIRARV